MGNFIAKLELPRFIPKEQIIGKYILDSDVVCLGVVEDWTYSPDGEVKMIVGPPPPIDEAKKKYILVPFSDIDRVGQFILLKSTKENLENVKLKGEGKDEDKDKIEKKVEGTKNELKTFDEIDHKIFDKFLKIKRKSS